MCWAARDSVCVIMGADLPTQLNGTVGLMLGERMSDGTSRRPCTALRAFGVVAHYTRSFLTQLLGASFIGA